VSTTPVLRTHDGSRLPLDTERWHRDATAAEMAVLAGIEGPVLDVGCGPGRFVVGLARLGVVALGIDPAPGAVAAARHRGAAVLQRSVFDTLPGERRWSTALLMDGNIGIGGDPVRLLRRCSALVGSAGTIVAELHPPGIGDRRHLARLEHAGATGPWFRWAEVGVDAIDAVALAARLRVDRIDLADRESRWFAWLRAEEQLSGVA
jgi:SAM-dependent methyltransferase